MSISKVLGGPRFCHFSGVANAAAKHLDRDDIGVAGVGPAPMQHVIRATARRG